MMNITYHKDVFKYRNKNIMFIIIFIFFLNHIGHLLVNSYLNSEAKTLFPFGQKEFQSKLQRIGALLL